MPAWRDRSQPNTRARSAASRFREVVGYSLAAACIAVLLSGGCQRPPAEPPGAVSRAERGPIRLEVSVAPVKVHIGDVVTVRVSVEAPEVYAIELPDESTLKELDARRTDDPLPRPWARGRLWQRSFTFEPAAAGRSTVPGLTIRYTGPPLSSFAADEATRAATQPAATSELVSEPLEVEVLSVLKPDDNPARPRDITGTLLPPGGGWPLWQRLAVVFLVAFGLGAPLVVYLALRGAVRPPPPPVPAEVWALAELDRLAGQDWFAGQRVATYYYRLTEIVRQYIERKFGLAAPEMTTEEFLVHVVRHPDTARFDPVRLRLFLEACDIVKYAAFTPGADDARAALETARAYVRETAAAAAAKGEAA